MEKVRTGQKFIPRAADWNSFIDAANFVRNHEQAENFSSKLDTVPGIVTVKNVTKKTFPIFSCLYLSDLAVFPESGSDSAAEDNYFFQPIVFAASNKPDPQIRSNRKVCIIQQPLKPNEIGKALAVGITHGKVNVTNFDHIFAKPTSDGKMVSAKKGPIEIYWQDGLKKGNQQCVLRIPVVWENSGSSSSSGSGSSGSSEPPSSGSSDTSSSGTPSSGSSGTPSSGSSGTPSSGSSGTPSSGSSGTPSSGSSGTPSSGSSGTPSSGSSGTPSSSSISWDDSSSSGSSGSSGEPIDCDDFEIEWNISGRYQWENHACPDIMVDLMVIYEFDGGPDSPVTYCYGVPPIPPENCTPNYNTAYSYFGVEVDKSHCPDYLRLRSYLFHRAGEYIEVSEYGTYELPVVGENFPGDCQYLPEDDMWIGSGPIETTSLPTATVTVRRKNKS